MMIELHNTRRQDEMLNNLMMTHIRPVDTTGPLTAVAASLAGVVGAVVDFAVRLYIRRKVYGELSAMTDRMLTDIGVSREEIGAVAERSARKAGTDESARVRRAINAGANVVSFGEKTKPTASLVVEQDEPRKAA